MTTNDAIRTILVPLDGSDTGERALPWAKAVAGSEAEIVLMEVTPVASTIRSFGGQVIGTAEAIQEGYRQMAEQQLNDAAAKWFDKDAKFSTVIASGDPGEQILAVAADKGADLIVMSSHGRGAIGRFVSGSVADRVVRHAPLPVMIIGPEGDIATDARITRVIAPLQDSDLSRAALPVAASIAKLTGTPVIVLNVIVPSTDLTGIYPGVVTPVPASAIDGAQEQMAEAAKSIVDQAVASLKQQGVEASGEVYSGPAADSIMAALQPGDVIVLSSHARQGLARWVIGSTSMKLIRNGQAPVVVVTRESIEQAALNAASAS
jgi:nucleotide-binding universal stress UspA family protein